jgi:hypothetical protein
VNVIAAGELQRHHRQDDENGSRTTHIAHVHASSISRA